MSIVLTRVCDVAAKTCAGDVAEFVVTLSGPPRALDLCAVHQAEWLNPLASLLDEHGRKVDAVVAATCPICGRSFANVQGLSTHRVRVHSERAAGGATGARKGVEPAGGRPLKCPLCELDYATSGGLRQHTHRTHGVSLAEAVEQASGGKPL